MAEDKKTCFCICPIGHEGSPIRKHSDQVLKYLVEAAVPSDYDVIRADELPRPGVITSQIFSLLQSAELVIADLSGANANVFYELAIRHVTRKLVIQLLSDDETLPFDVAPIRTISFNIRDLDSVDRAKHDLAAHVKALEEHPEVETPVSAAIQLQIAEKSDEPLARLIIEMARTLAQLSEDVRRLKATGATRVYTPGAWSPPSSSAVDRDILFQVPSQTPSWDQLAFAIAARSRVDADMQRMADHSRRAAPEGPTQRARPGLSDGR